MAAVTQDDPWVLVPVGRPPLSPRSLNQDERVITVLRDYLTTSRKFEKLVLSMCNGPILRDFRLERRLDYLDVLLQEMGVFESKHCGRETWRLKRLSKLTAAQRDSIDRNLMTENDRKEYQTSQHNRYFGRYSLPVIFGISPPSVKGVQPKSRIFSDTNRLTTTAIVIINVKRLKTLAIAYASGQQRRKSRTVELKARTSDQKSDFR